MRLPRLVSVACWVVILAGTGEALSSIREVVGEVQLLVARPKLNPTTETSPREEPMENSAYTNAEAGHVTFTNMSNATLHQCIRAVVRRKNGDGMARSVAVCTGDVKPNSTVVLEAPYPAGSVRNLCSRETADRYGNYPFDWDLCTFDVEPVGAGSISASR
jgi:hypothetical protein